MRDKVIVALDLGDPEQAVVMAASLRNRAQRVKVGLTLYGSEGPRIVRRLAALDFAVFLDLKLHDIPHQVAGACRELTKLGVEMFTVHACGGHDMLRRATEAVWETASEEGIVAPKVLAVTVLTSMSAEDLLSVGVSREPAAQVAALTRVAKECGVDGVVCSPGEAREARSILGPDALVVTPGVRLAGDDRGDQTRVATPSAALEAGATYLVVGRPITGARDPVAAFERIVASIEDEA